MRYVIWAIVGLWIQLTLHLLKNQKPLPKEESKTTPVGGRRPMVRTVHLHPSKIREVSTAHNEMSWKGGGFEGESYLSSSAGDSWVTHIWLDYGGASDDGMEFNTGLRPTREDVMTFCYKTALRYGFLFEGIVK